MVFLFFENIQRTPSPGFAPCQSPSGGVPTAPQKPTERPERRRGTSTHTSKKNAVERPQNAPQRTPAKTAPTQHEPKHRHRTRAAIQDYILQRPGRSSRPQRCTGGTEGNRKRPEPKPGALRLIYSFSTGQQRPRTEKLKYKVKSNLFTPSLNRKTAVRCRGAVLGE